MRRDMSLVISSSINQKTRLLFSSNNHFDERAASFGSPAVSVRIALERRKSAEFNFRSTSRHGLGWA